MGINRNIVECKYRYIYSLHRWSCVLIETLWNVNYLSYSKCRNVSRVLIETLWNVNLYRPLLERYDRKY